MELDAGTPTDCAETLTPAIVNGTSCNLESATYRTKQVFRRMNVQIWKNLNTAPRASRFFHMYNELVMNKNCQLNKKFEPQLCVYRFTQEDS